ncbi:hypothetical protein B0H14DRAFT_3753181 [Mycena olivaceomarginata]|nr:hypothetical protein B0H14DRAFT_3753181 [Mycena olivaceomarginata]
MWPVMAHHLSAEQLNINSLFTAAASTPPHSCAPAWLATSFAGSLPPPLSTQSALAVRSGLPPPASHGDAIPPKLSSNMSHMKNRCTPQLPLIVRGSFVIAVRTRPGPRPSEFRRHRGRDTRTSTEYIPPTRTVSWKGPSTTFLPMWSILLCHSHPVGLGSPPPHLFCAPLPRPSCMRRLCPLCSDPMHHASLTPLHALALRAFPSHTMRGPIFTLLNWLFWLCYQCQSQAKIMAWVGFWPGLRFARTKARIHCQNPKLPGFEAKAKHLTSLASGLF